MMLMLKPCQNTGIPMHSSQRLLLESAESEAGILMGTDFSLQGFQAFLLTDAERLGKQTLPLFSLSPFSLSLSHTQKNTPSTLCMCVHMCLLWLIHF